MKFTVINAEVDAVQWFKNGDHQLVRPPHNLTAWREEIGFIDIDGRDILVHIGDYIVTTASGALSVINPDVFERMYQPA